MLLEVGLHNPLAAAIGHAGQSEWQLSVQLLAQLAKGCLLLADRLYGCAAFAVEAGFLTEVSLRTRLTSKSAGPRNFHSWLPTFLQMAKARVLLL